MIGGVPSWTAAMDRAAWDALLAALADALIYDWPDNLPVPPGATMPHTEAV